MRRSTLPSRLTVFGFLTCFLLSGSPARALNFDFSVTEQPGSGNFNGTFTGEVFGLTDNATGAASSVEIDTLPAGFTNDYGTLPIVVTNFVDIPINSFTVSGGQITGALFGAEDLTTTDEFVLASGEDNFFGNAEGQDIGNFASASSTFTPAGGGAPELDASQGLSAFALACFTLALFGERRKGSA